jgi:sortase A
VADRRRPLLAVLRFVASVLITSGVLLLADAGVTLAWQEPLSTLVAGRSQASLDGDLRAAPRVLGVTRGAPGDPRAVARMAGRWKRRTKEGQALGHIGLPTLGRRYAVVAGTELGTLRKGPGHYRDTPLPGQRGTVAIAGHRTTYGAPFRTVDRLRRGDPIVVRMPYARFVYEVERTRIVAPTAVWVKRRAAHDRLVLSACHPLYSAAQRIVVFARFVRYEPGA